MGTSPQHGAGGSASGASREDEIRRYLKRLLATPGFASSPRRSKLLAYLCDQTLNGQGERITEYALAFDVFDKPPSFDPRTESTVRAELTRVRQKLKDYYEGDGRTDPIVVELPLRSYILTFSFRQTEEACNATEPTAPFGWKRFSGPATALGLCTILAAVGFYILRPRIPDPPPLSLAILPVIVEPSASDLQGAADEITELMNDSVVLRVTRASVIEGHTAARFRGRSGWREARGRLVAALFLETSIGRRDGTLHASMTIRRKSDGGDAWSGVFPIKLDSMGRMQGAIRALVSASVLPVLEREAIYLDYVRSKGPADAPAPIAGLRDPGNPCSGAKAAGLPFGGADAELLLFEYARAARSYDTRIPFQVGLIAYPAQPAQTRFAVKAGIPLALRAPEFFQLAADTCILTSYTGTSPVYQRRCIVPAAGSSELALRYLCAPKAYPIDISRAMNDGNLWDADMAPTGPRLFDRVPFIMPEGRNRYWRGTIAAEGGARPVSLSIPVNRTVSTAYFLLNTEWGQPGPESYLDLEFQGDGDAHFEKKLVGGVDVRDYHNGTTVNTVDGRTTHPIFDFGRGERIDLVEVGLPNDFRSHTLESITLRDTGRYGFQRAILWAVTVR
ncbi:MAG: hypothetical protein ABSH50_32190 [Bryobacteraceae bacterium]|jgi:hypothetical protein